MASVDVSNSGTLKIKEIMCNEMRGAYTGGANCDTVLDARGINAAWDTDRIVATMSYGNNTTSTLKFTEVGAGKIGTGDDTNPNITISGIADPVTDQDAANKKYVDQTVGNIVNIHDNVIQHCSTATPTPAYAANGSTLTFVANSLGFTFVDSTSVTFTSSGNAVIIRQGVVADRILFSNVGGAGADKRNGVYVLTSVDAAGSAVFTRSTDLDTPAELQRGELVLVASNGQGTATDNGNAYYLANTVTDISDAAGTAQEWDPFTSTGVQSFTAPLVLSATGNLTCEGNTGGSEEGLPLVGVGAGVDEGKAVFGQTVGLTGNVFRVNATAFTLTDLGTTELTATTKTDFNPAAGPALITSTTETVLNLQSSNPNTNPGIYTSLSRAHIFGKLAGGTAPETNLANVRIGLVEDAGHIVCNSAGVTNSTDAVGSGILFDTANAFSTANANTFLIAPQSTTTANTCSLSIFSFDVAGAGSVIASFSQ